MFETFIDIIQLACIMNISNSKKTILFEFEFDIRIFGKKIFKRDKRRKNASYDEIKDYFQEKGGGK
ncbi:hypothetical protein [Lactococcus petauri]|uniref:hypothetical protein n=1 Tax=Lactococcus petauri TaxID=1940789 RepID=UPI0018AC5A0D|nr:hypothetical protein [Lactococcus petauri]MDC0826975.1 hypothetical protein [Lactococcus petauri]